VTGAIKAHDRPDASAAGSDPVSHTLGAEDGLRFGVIDELRAAVDAFNRGDPEPFVALIDEDSEWRGISRGHLWWKHAPS
jgi:hypothetical protein